MPSRHLTQRPVGESCSSQGSVWLERWPWGGPRLPRPNSRVMAQEETAPTFPSPALPLPSPDPSAEIQRLPPALHTHTAQ